jgi:predicted secreted protein
MASKAIAGVGTKFKRWNAIGAPAAWADIAEINSITGPGMSRDTIDVTSLDSTGGYREFITGFRNAGTVVLAMNFTRETYELMKDDFESNVAQNYQIVLPDDENTGLDFEGLVTELPLTIPADDKVTADVTIQITGKVEISSGGASSIP